MDADGVCDGVRAAEPVRLRVPEPVTVGVRVGEDVRDAPNDHDDVGDIDGVSVPDGDIVSEQLPAAVSRVVAQASGHGQLSLGLSPPRQ